MSMLAEPKRKQHWTLNPRGKQWSEDSSKFGQKILEKMGWTNGEGLGPKGQGIKEHIRVKLKNDQVGIGYKKDCDNQWTHHQDNFNNFLQNLQMEEETKNIVENKTLNMKSLEEKSKQSQKRVDYKKFTSVKDVNKYNTKDLANIFGKKDFSKDIVNETNKEDKKICDPVGKQDTTAGILTIKGGYINDYFKKRFDANENNNTVMNGDRSESAESDKEKYFGFGFPIKSENTFNITDRFHSDIKTSENNYKYSKFSFTKCDEIKSKNRKQNDLNYVFDNPCLDLNILDDNETVDAKCLEKKISKKRKHQVILQDTMDNLDNSEKLFKKQKRNIANDDKCSDILSVNSVKMEQKNNVYINEGLNIDYSEELKYTDENNINNKSSITQGKLESKLKSMETLKKRKKGNKFEVFSNAYENAGLDLDCSDMVTQKEIKTEIKKENICETILNTYENLGLDLNSSISEVSGERKIVENISNRISDSALVLDCSHNSKTRTLNDKIEYNIETTKKKKKKLKLDKYKVVKKNEDKDKQVVLSSFVNEALDLETIRKEEKEETQNLYKFMPNTYENLGLDLNSQIIEKSKEKNNAENLLNKIPNLTIVSERLHKPKKHKTQQHMDNKNLSNGVQDSVSEMYFDSNNVPNCPEVKKNHKIENTALKLSSKEENRQIESHSESRKKKTKKSRINKHKEVMNKNENKDKPVVLSGFVNQALDLDVIVKEENDVYLELSRKNCKRRKSRRISLLETIEEVPEENSNVIFVSEDELKNSDRNLESVRKLKPRNVTEIDISDSPPENFKSNRGIDYNKSVKDEEINIVKEIIDVEHTKNAESFNNKTKINKENICSSNNETRIKKRKRKSKLADDDVVFIPKCSNKNGFVEKIQTEIQQKFESPNNRNQSIPAKTELIDVNENQSFLQKSKKSKQVIKSLFVKNPILLFHGSNINEIKGYGIAKYNNELIKK